MVAVNPTKMGAGMNRAFSAADLTLPESLGRCPRLFMNAAPLALDRYAARRRRARLQDNLNRLTV